MTDEDQIPDGANFDKQYNAYIAKRIEGVAEQLKEEASKPTIIQEGLNTIVGESHMHVAIQEDKDHQFQHALDDSEIVVLEHNPTIHNPATEDTKEKRLMLRAHENAVKEGKELLILDEYLNRLMSWKEAVPDIDLLDYVFIHGVNLAFHSMMMGKEFDETVTLMSQINSQQPFLHEKVARNLAVLSASAAYENTDPDYIVLTSEALLLLGRVDSQVRERAYQRMAQNTQKLRPDKKALYVVGKNHAQGIAEALKDPSHVTQIDQSQVAKLKQSISDLKARFQRWH